MDRKRINARNLKRGSYHVKHRNGMSSGRSFQCVLDNLRRAGVKPKAPKRRKGKRTHPKAPRYRACQW